MRRRLGVYVLLAMAVTGVIVWILVAGRTDPERHEAITGTERNHPPPSLDLPLSEKVAPPGRPPKIIPSANARDGELLVRFKNAGEVQVFLARARQLGVRVLGRLPRLNTVRIGYDTSEQGEALHSSLPAGATAESNFIVSVPANPEPGSTAFGGPYLGFGDQALSWLGVPTDHSSWGEGIKIAVLDSGVKRGDGGNFQSVQEIDLIGSQSKGMSDHGTAVTSIATSVAPEASVLSIKVIDAQGVGDSFTVAEGILEAVDNGARVINISLGSEGDSSVLRNAVNYALQNNVAVVAAAGNEGATSVSFPAAYPGVIAVTAVDANGRHATFANTGAVSIAAPGIAVGVPWTDVSDPATMFSGTSAAAPFVSGTIAGILSQSGSMTAREAGNLLIQYSNDAGAPGQDAVLGSGILNVDRVVKRNVSGINDAAIADIYVTPSKSGQYSAAVTIQNRGTTILNGAQLEIQVGGQTWRYQFGGLNVGQVATQTLSLTSDQLTQSSGIEVQSRVSTAATDSKPANDAKTVILSVEK
ncbi:MAG TPA: S8 family serine peptidase [Chthoniobacterales bacterium]